MKSRKTIKKQTCTCVCVRFTCTQNQSGISIGFVCEKYNYNTKKLQQPENFSGDNFLCSASVYIAFQHSAGFTEVYEGVQHVQRNVRYQ